jgi:serine/threonine protein kinase
MSADELGDPARTAVRPAEHTRAGEREPGASAATLLRPAAPPPTELRPRPQDLEGAEAAPSGPAIARHPELVAGTVIKERFLLEELIGRGGMGRVFRALDRSKEVARNPQPHVAIKILNADVRGHPQALMALEREASKAQSLAHPNIVTVFDFDLAGDTPFITMELLRGSSLERVIANARSGGIGRARALPLIRGIAEGLAYAHRKGIVHSDLKPENVFLLEDGTPKILDFGIARAVAADRGDASPHDEFDARSLGAYTEAYATQEMVAGADPDPADDVYALGLVAYQLLSGRHPFKRMSAPAARAAGIEPAPLRGLKRRERIAIERALAFERSERFADAGAFLHALRIVPAIQKALVAAVGVLVLAAGGFWYRSYLASLPDVPLSQLPAEVQHDFATKIAEGNESLAYIERTHDPSASQDAAKLFGEAYQLHPRDPAAVRGLKAAADYAIDWYSKYPDKQEALAQLETFRARSDYYKTYAPMQRAIRAAGGN